MSKFILAKKDGGEGFKRNFAIYLVNYFFSKSKNRCCSKFVLKYMKDVNRIASLDWYRLVLDKLISNVRNYKETKAAKVCISMVHCSS